VAEVVDKRSYLASWKPSVKTLETHLKRKLQREQWVILPKWDYLSKSEITLDPILVTNTLY
jgi:hypothetical protein